MASCHTKPFLWRLSPNHKSGSSLCMSRVHVLSFHQSFIPSIRSHRVSSSTPYISYLPPFSGRASRLATSRAALFSPLKDFRSLSRRQIKRLVPRTLIVLVTLADPGRTSAIQEQLGFLELPDTGMSPLLATKHPIS